jgi:hypothetical protein
MSVGGGLKQIVHGRTWQDPTGGKVKKHFVFSEGCSHSTKKGFCRTALIAVLLSNVIVISVALLYPVQGKGGASKAFRANTDRQV